MLSSCDDKTEPNSTLYIGSFFSKEKFNAFLIMNLNFFIINNFKTTNSLNLKL